MATQPICLDREALLNVVQVAAVEGNDQLSSLLSQLSPAFFWLKGAAIPQPKAMSRV